MDVRTLGNVSRNSLHWRNLRVMTHKVWLRAADHVTSRERQEARRWCSEQSEPVESYARSIDPGLWEEALAFGQELEEKGRERLETLGVDLGGGGHYPLLYFLTRHLRPKAVLETGVAAGFSSAAILAALSRNGHGELFSSDFPYFRLEDPERFVGVMVDEGLKDRWHLYLEGDRHNLPRIAEVIGEDVSLLHYDSDKSPSGKRYFVESIVPKVTAQADRAVLILDDVDDDSFFKSLVDRQGAEHHVFHFGGKYLGLVALR